MPRASGRRRRRVADGKFEARLNLENPVYQDRIRDWAGKERYQLTITPKNAPGENRITSWQVSLGDARPSFYGNLLQFDPEPLDDPKDNLFWLNPARSSPVPIRARRIIKGDGSYLLFQVKDFPFAPLDSPYLDSMTVQFELTNSDPRQSKESTL
jgi:hypothetical protein